MKRAARRRRVPPEELARLSIDDLQRRARAVMDRAAYDYYRTGARDEVTLRDNRRAFRRLVFVPRVLQGIESISLATTVLGEPIAIPILAAPSAGHRLAHPDGELATAAGVTAAGTMLVLSTSSTVAIEAVIDAPARAWFQLYPFSDRGFTAALVQRAVTAGARAVVLTVDTTAEASTHRRPRGGYAWPTALELPLHGTQRDVQLSLDWSDVDRLVASAGVPVVLKGVLHPDDARLAADHGAAGIVVSNHGGRNLDSAIASVDALPAIRDAVGDRLEVYLDGGVRRGGDVLKALALGARAVLIGRPVLWGLATAGADGVAHVFRMLADELLADATLAGVRDVTAVPRDLVAHRAP